MKKSLLFLLVLILIALVGLIAINFFGDSSEGAVSSNAFNEELASTSYPYEDNHLYAIEYLGYDYKELEKLTGNGADFFNLGGEDYYYVVPRYNDMAVEIYKNYMENNSRELIFSSKKARTFVIKGNESDIFPNITIKFTSSNGEVAEVTPYISLKDGSFIAEEHGLIINSGN